MTSLHHPLPLIVESGNTSDWTAFENAADFREDKIGFQSPHLSFDYR
jgi:hypothetical protein